MKVKRGEGYISVCVLLIVVCMLLSVFVTFANAINVVKMTERNSRVVLDNFVMQDAIEIFDSIKRGNSKNATIDRNAYTDKLLNFCTFVKNGNYLYAYDSKRQEIFKLSLPTMGYSDASGILKLYVSYNVYVPLYFCGTKVTTATIPIKVYSKYTDKY